MVTRGAEREQAIRDATIGLLTEASYESLTIDAVAARARSSTTTIYRGWTNKAELVGRGEVDRLVSADLVHEVTEAMVLRQIALDLPWDDEFLRRLTDDILLPLLTSNHPASDRSVS